MPDPKTMRAAPRRTSTSRRAWARLFVALLAGACGESPAATTQDPPASVADPEAREAPGRSDPEEAAPIVLAGAPDAPESGCSVGEAARVDAGEWSAITAAESGFVVAGTVREGEGEVVFVVHVAADGASRVLARAALEHPAAEHRRAAPALAAVGDRVALALADGERRLLFAELDMGATDAVPAWRVMGESASLRFAPALAAHGRGGWALAFTVEDADSMRVEAAFVEGGAVRGRRELRPPAGGSAAPSFVAGARVLTVVFLDPRAGVSVAHRARASAGSFGDPVITRPINLVTEPPALAAARIGETEWLAYTAIGSAATTAVGLVRLDGTAPPVALVPGTGYGVLHVDAATLSSDRAIFVADAPQGTDPAAPRELHVRVVGTDGVPAAPIVVRGPSGAAARGRIAHAGGGVIALSFTSAGAIFVAIGRCAEER